MEPGAAQEPGGRGGRPPAPESVRRQKRRELDARRSKCRIRIGGHLERWCRLKEQLGFALHSQLAQFLLDRATLGSKEAGEEGTAKSPHGDGDRGQEMGDGDGGGTAPQVSLEPGPVAAAGERSLSSSSIPGDDAEPGAEPREEEEEDEDFAKGDDLAYTDDLRDENYHPSLDSDSEPQRRQGQPKARRKPIKEEQPLLEQPLPSPGPLEEKSGQVRQPRASDKDVAQIGPKRIRKAAKHEILLCDFEGCGKIFSNRQYLNHHQKYQHMHQKTFTCSEPTCGKSFNFKKHLKEHEKLHSDKRDYICEFCARSFRTSSNLIIHRRIHTGEKPLQCEICGFTCRQKASLNWHMRKHDADSFYQFPCDICGKRFEKRDNVTAHKSKSHPGGLRQPEGPQQQPPEPPGPMEALELLGAVLGPGGDTGRAPLEFGVGDVGGEPPQGQGRGEEGS
ncbi:zinc finger protein 692 isoform X2 [Agelaius tricolor]|uniref:zinc finger protein 692 isoform X2 n=1 Tax=Agelaius tricolor TaxID=9191 RepID=UPI0039F242CC